VTEILKPKYTLVLGSAAYTALLAANIYPRAYTLLPAAAINGIGAGLIWTAQGARPHGTTLPIRLSHLRRLTSLIVTVGLPL